jgi:hypothetical protein
VVDHGMALSFALRRDAKLVEAFAFIDFGNDQADTIFTKLKGDKGVKPLVANFPFWKHLLFLSGRVFR